MMGRRGVDRTRSSLGRDHVTHGSRWRLCALLLRCIGDRSCRSRRRRRRVCDLHCRRSLSLLRSSWLCCRGTLGSGYRRAQRHRSRSLLCQRRSGWRRSCKRRTRSEHRLNHALSRSFRSWCGRSGGNGLLSSRRRWCCRFRRSCGRGSSRFWSRRRGRFGLLLQQKAGHITGLRDVREIDLGLDLWLTSTTAAIPTDGSTALSREVFAHTLGFVGLNRARVRLLFRYSDQGKDVENRLAFDFQLPCQIVDSNFTHSRPLRFSENLF